MVLLLLTAAAVAVSGQECSEEAKLRDRVAELENELADTVGRFESAETDWSAARAKLEESIRSFETAAEALKTGLDDCNRKLEAPQDKDNGMEETLQAAKEERDAAKAEIEGMTARLERAEREQAELKEKLGLVDSRFDEMKRKLEDGAKATAEQLLITHDQLNNAKNELMEKARQLKEYEESVVHRLYLKMSDGMAMLKAKFGKDDKEL